MIYLDANATEPLRPEARAALLAALEATGNPSSVHAAGRAARRLLEGARETIAARFGATPAGVVFTSGGTEADALAVHALGAGRRVIVGATEHDAVRAAAPGAEVLAVDGDGVADPDALARLLADGGPALVCLMLANNETGTIQPVAEAARLCRAAGARLHVDAVQAAGRMPVDFVALGADSLALSSHKLGGPTGAGALLLAGDLAATGALAPLIAGGGQERGRRGGTPPVAAIAGFAAAAAVATNVPHPPSPLAGEGWGGGDTTRTASVCAPPSPCPLPQGEGEECRMAALRDAAEAAAVAAGARVIGAGAARLANTTCLALAGVRADTQVIALDLAGICVSAGAACSSGKVAESHVLRAMGLGRLAGEAIRVSLPWNATAADIAAFTDAYRAMASRLARRAA
jgi:cysteine desulfurase